MKTKKMIFFLMTFLLLIIPLEAKNSPQISEELVRDMIKTYGFCMSQQYTCDKIQELFPQYKKEVIEAQFKFYTQFGASIKKIDELFSESGDSWETMKKKSMDKIKSLSDFSNLSDSEIKEFISDVNKRAQGNILSPVLETLLIFHPDYIRNPALEFRNEYTKKFNSEDHPKNKDIHFTVQYPASWKSNEADRPNIIKKFSSENGRGLENFSILIKHLPTTPNQKPSKTNIEELFQKSTVLKMLPKDIVITSYSRTTIDSLPGAMVEYEEVQSRLKYNFFSKNLIFMTFYKNSVLAFSFSVGNVLVKKNDVLERYPFIKPLFILIANSIVIQDLWKHQHAVLEATINTSDKKDLQKSAENFANNEEVKKLSLFSNIGGRMGLLLSFGEVALKIFLVSVIFLGIKFILNKRRK